MTLSPRPAQEGGAPREVRRPKICDYCRGSFTPDAAPHTKCWQRRRYCRSACANRHRRELAAALAAELEGTPLEGRVLIDHEKGVPVYRVPADGRTNRGAK